MKEMNRRLNLINKAKKESQKKGKFSLVIEGQHIREYMRFENGEISIYDITGKEKNQVPLSLEELNIIKEMEAKNGSSYSRVNRERKTGTM